MRKIIATEFYTLDGMMSDLEDKMTWVTDSFSKDMGESVDAVYKECDTLLLGANTYKIMAEYWPTAATNPNTFEGDAEFAEVMNGIHKIVFSQKIEEVTWNNTEIKREIELDDIKALKKQPGKNILIAGSASVVQQLTNLKLIDEYHILLHPIILGPGKLLFKGITEQHPLKLIESQVLKNGVVMLRYALA